MKCAQCGHELSEDAAICPECGLIPVEHGRPSDAAAAEGHDDAPVLILPEGFHPGEETAGSVAPAPPDESPDQPPEPPLPPEAPPAPVAVAPPRKSHGCAMGCLSVLGVVLLVFLLGLAVVFDLPARMGLTPSTASRMLVDKPDYAARAVMLNEFREAGQPTQGILIYVLPYRGTDQSLAYVVLDQSKGYSYVITSFDDPVSAALILAARSKAVDRAHIVRVAVDFRESDGTTLFVLTAPVEAIRQYADKTITREQFFASLEGHGNFARIYRNQLDFIRDVRGAQ